MIITFKQVNKEYILIADNNDVDGYIFNMHNGIELNDAKN